MKLILSFKTKKLLYSHFAGNIDSMYLLFPEAEKIVSSLRMHEWVVS